MKQAFEFRKEALNLLTGNWKDAVAISLIIFLLQAAAYSIATSLTPIDYIGLSSLAINVLLLYPIVYVFRMQLLALSRQGKRMTIPALFWEFKNKYQRSTPVMGLICLYIMLWMLLLLIPGIIKGYSYAMASYISMDNEELSAEECINQSMKMMDGHKMRLFLLELSFIGWVLLSILTCGIGFIWLNPYMEAARLKFYEDLKAQTALQ